MQNVLTNIVPHVLGEEDIARGGLREPAHDVPAAGGVGSLSCPKFGTNAAQGTRYLMEGFLDQCVEKYCE